MSRFTPKPAVRTGQKARVAISGPSGAGKTWDALLLATELAEGGPILVVDTERGTSALYSDQFSFDLVEWTPPFDPRELAAELPGWADAYEVVVLDSLTHFWEGQGGTRDIVDAAAARAKGNSFAGWKEGTPAQDAMVHAILSAPCHVFATMRSKTEYVLEERGGKQVPRKVGMAPIQRAGMEYEFTVTCEVDRDHTLIVDKSRCIELSDAVFQPSEVRNLALMLAAWLERNEPAPEPREVGLLRRLAALPEDARKRIEDWWPSAGWMGATDEALDRAAEVLAKAEKIEASTEPSGSQGGEGVSNPPEDPPAPPSPPTGDDNTTTSVVGEAVTRPATNRPSAAARAALAGEKPALGAVRKDDVPSGIGGLQDAFPGSEVEAS